jgi:hypothetical protein
VKRIWIAAAIAALATAASAQPFYKSRQAGDNGVMLWLNEQVTVDLSEPGKFRIADIRSADPTLVDATPRAVTGNVTFGFRSDGKGGVLLMVSNGLDARLRYHLVPMQPPGADGKVVGISSEACPVKARGASVAHWPASYVAMLIQNPLPTTDSDTGCKL